MASKNPKKTKKCKSQPLPSTSFPEAGACHTELIIHDELDEETLNLLCCHGQYFDHKERNKKRRKKKREIQIKGEKSKQCKIKWKTLEMEMKDLSELCTEKENLDCCQEKATLPRNVFENNLSFKNNKKLKKKKLQVSNVENCFHKKRCKKNTSCKSIPASFTSFSSPLSGKKAKGQKQSQDFVNVGFSKSKFRGKKHEKPWTSPKPLQINKSQMRQQRLYKYLCSYPSQNFTFIEETEQTVDDCCEDVSSFKTICPAEVPEPTFQSSVTENLKTFNKLHKAIPACDSLATGCHELKACPYSSAPSLSPDLEAPEIKSDDLEDELNMEDLKHTKYSPIKAEEACSSVDLSQDLFITQKSFGPVQVSSNDSCSSSFHNDTKEMHVDEYYKHHSPMDRMQWFSQAPSKKLKAIEQCHIAETRLSSTSRKKRIVTKEKATQTDDFLSSSLLVSHISHAKRFTICSVQPLDLSLPFRVRSSSSCTKEVSYPTSGIHLIPKPVQDPILCTEEQLPNAKTPSIVYERDREKGIFSQSRKSEEGRYVQTFLNSSYFFKGKGEVDIGTPMVPLLKQRSENEKRLSGEDRSQSQVRHSDSKKKKK